MVLIFWWEQTESCIYLETRRYTNLNIKVAAWKTFRPRPLDCRAPHRCWLLSRIGDPRRPPENRASPAPHPGLTPGRERGQQKETKQTQMLIYVLLYLFSINLLFTSVFYAKTLVKGKGLQHLAHFVRRETWKWKQTNAFQLRPPEDRRELLSSLRILSVKEKGAGRLFFFFFSVFCESESRSVLSDFSDPMDYTVHGISRPEYWSGQPFLSSGDLPNPGIELGSPALHADSLPSEPPGKPFKFPIFLQKIKWIWTAFTTGKSTSSDCLYFLVLTPPPVTHTLVQTVSTLLSNSIHHRCALCALRMFSMPRS